MSNLKFPKIDLDSTRIVAYSDAAFDDNHDLKSQLGSIELLMYDNNSAISIIFKSYMLRRVARSVLSV